MNCNTTHYRANSSSVPGDPTAGAFKITVPNLITTNNNLITLTGEAPVEAVTIRVNGVDYPITWVNVKSWLIRLPVNGANNVLTIQGYDRNGNPLSGFTTNVTVNYTGTVAAPETSVVFNEIMYNPAVSNASYIEIYNKSTFAFDVSGWTINGLDYTFPNGSFLGGGQYLVLAKDIGAFTATYGGLAPYGVFSGNLDLDGETLTLLKPATIDSPELIIDKVRYEARLPWPTMANGGNTSLQLYDPNVDTSRVSAWSDGIGWRLFTTNINLGNSAGTRLYIFLDGVGDVYLDDISLVPLAGPNAGSNQVQNGDFESALTGPWSLGTNVAGSTISGSYSHSGIGSLHLVSTVAGSPVLANSFSQDVGAATNLPYTLSYYYLPTTNANKLTMRFNSSARPENIVRQGVLYTPGAANLIAATLPPYDPVWLNEIQPNNVTGPLDNFGEHEPWVELYNSGTSPVSLAGYYLADNYTNNLTQWQFPANATINPGEFKTVWLDGQTNQGTASQWHASFRPGLTAGQVALVRIVGIQPQITDYLTYSGLGASLSYGDFPEGQPFTRQVFYQTSPGSSNISRAINVFVNEWMAANTNVVDPASAPGAPEYDDWFELFNSTAFSVDLSGYYLTDNLGNKTQFRVPTNGQYVIPANGFLVVWADNQTEQNTPGNPDLHVNFQLNKDGEAIGLFAADGVTPVDTITFGPQTNSISQGRFSDGAAGPYYYMTMPTPGAPNLIGLPNTAPTVDPISDRTIRVGQSVSLTAVGHDQDVPVQTLTFSLDAHPSGATISSGGLFAWTPTQLQAPSTNNVTVRVTDNGVPPLSGTATFKVIVRLPPAVTISNNGGGQVTVGFDTIPGRTYRIEWKQNLDDPFWTPLGADTQATGDVLTVNDNIGANHQRFYHAIQVD